MALSVLRETKSTWHWNLRDDGGGGIQGVEGRKKGWYETAEKELGLSPGIGAKDFLGTIAAKTRGGGSRHHVCCLLIINVYVNNKMQFFLYGCNDGYMLLSFRLTAACLLNSFGFALNQHPQKHSISASMFAHVVSDRMPDLCLGRKTIKNSFNSAKMREYVTGCSEYIATLNGSIDAKKRRKNTFKLRQRWHTESHVASCAFLVSLFFLTEWFLLTSGQQGCVCDLWTGKLRVM